MNDGVLIVEPCQRCGRAQTIMRAPTGALAPTCICCGGAGLARDRYCRHYEPQADLPLKPPAPAR